jgi:hypothetical protein
LSHSSGGCRADRTPFWSQAGGGTGHPGRAARHPRRPGCRPAPPTRKSTSWGLPRELRRVRDLIAHGLASTANQWPATHIAFSWLHRVAHLLNNSSGRDIGLLRRAYRRLLAKMRQGARSVGPLESAVHHFLRVTSSCWPGLFVCYTRPDIPRTNNDLEHVFGPVRYHQRRASGRKVAALTLLIRGSVRLIAATCHQHALTSAELQPKNLTDRRALRQQLMNRSRIPGQSVDGIHAAIGAA